MATTFTFFIAANFTIEDDGIYGNSTSVISRNGNGTVLNTFSHPADSITFLANTAGVNLAFNFADSLGAAQFNVGSLTDPAQTPDSVTLRRVETTGAATIVANNAIAEGGADAGTDIRAGSLIMSAGAGVGTSGNAIEIQTSILEAQTNTGGIFLSNIGQVQIGGLSDSLGGLRVADSGSVQLTNTGSILLADATNTESVRSGAASGDVTLTANGFDSDILATVNRDAISASAGNITLTATRDIAFGTAGANFDNDVRAAGSITVNAGRDFLVDGFADLESDNFGTASGGNIVINAGRTIGILNNTGTNAGVLATGSAGADVILVTGAGGTVIVNAEVTSAVGSTSGDVFVNADRVLIGGTSGISALAGQVVLRPASAGREIILGSLTDGLTALELSDGELDRIFADSLTIGSANAGSISVGAPISPLVVPDLTLHSGEDIAIESGMTVSGALVWNAGDNVYLDGAVAISAASLSVLVDQVGNDGNLGGFADLSGVSGVAAITITGNVDSDTLTGSNGNDTINGGAGADIMRGLEGDDRYIVAAAGDQTIEEAAEGTDTVFSFINWTLGANIERLDLAGSATNATGNSLNNTLIGNDQNNVLNGGAGNDYMRGGLGNDIYIVAAAGDVTDEDPNQGTDTVRSFISWTLAADVERLELLGSGNLNGTGNALNNTLVGNSGNNTLNGGGGNDFMAGGGGNDIYVVESAGDSTVEAANAGTDTVRSFVSRTLANNIERLELQGSGNLNGSGNALNNTLVGNSGNNTLNGGAGNDFIVGGAGNDSFVFNTALDAATNVDTISGFSVTDDTIVLENAIFAGLTEGPLAAGAFHIGTGAAAADDRIIYNSSTGALLFDADGAGGTASIRFATLSAGLALTADHFLVV